MTDAERPCWPIPRRRHANRGRGPLEWSVQCACGTYQSPWRASQAKVAAFYAGHVAERSTREPGG